jgi:hypothetical protein
MNQKLKDLFLGKDYDARQAAFAARLRADVEAEHAAMFKGRAVVLRAGDIVQIKGTDTQGVVRRVTKETDGSLYARVRVPAGAVIEAPAPVVVKAAVVTPAVTEVPANAFGEWLNKVGGAVERSITATFDSIAAEGAKAAERTRTYLDGVLPGAKDADRERDHFINIDRLVKVEKKTAAPQPRVG